MCENWCSPSDRKPDDGSPVEWLDANGTRCIGTYNRGLWMLPDGAYIYYEPTFWRPIEQLRDKRDELRAHITRIKALAGNPTDGFSTRCMEVTKQCDAALRGKPL